VKSGEMLGAMLLTWSNLAYYQHLMSGIREAISAGRFTDFRAAAIAGWAAGDIPPV
jgi:queuine tRNA-ribosyltransferase